MTELYAGIFAVGALVLGLGLLSGVIPARLPLSMPLLALAAGLLLGPAGFGVFDPAGWGARDRILGEAARLTLAIGLMATALRLPPRYFQQHWKLQAALLGLAMPLMWLASAMLAFIWLGVPLPLALLIGAVITPTDPIVATSIVTGAAARERLPGRVRHALSAESGANDGLAHALVALPLLLVAGGVEAQPLLGEWVAVAVIREIGGGLVLGVLIGLAAGRLVRFGEERLAMEEASFLAFTVALALLVVGAAGLVQVNGVLAVFAAGLAFDNMVGGSERAEEANVQEAVNQFFTLPIFALIGLVLPLRGWLDLGWAGAGLAISILLLRRLPAILALRPLLPPVHHRHDLLFLGWFGPIGVSALLYSSEALQRTGAEIVWTVTSLIICASIVLHGVSATPLTRRYAALERRKDTARGQPRTTRPGRRPVTRGRSGLRATSDPDR